MTDRKSRRVAALLGGAATVLIAAWPSPAAAQCVTAAGISCGGAGADGANGPTTGPLPGSGVPGGAGQAGPAVGETIDATIATTGGVPALDVVTRGGNGGKGGTGALVGGRGGAGGDGGAVSVGLSGSFTTLGDFSAGIHLGSYGGRGGDSGATGFTGAIDPGRGGAGGAVTLVTGATVKTSGFATSGIFVESLGGSAGNQSALGGGSGPLAGIGGRVSIANSGAVTTLGDESRALHAVSIGGNGGNGVVASRGGGRGAAGGDIGIANTGALDTTGAGGHGVDAFSAGGAGGAGFDTSSVFSTNAGTGGEGGAGGAVDVSVGGTVATRGADAIGVRVDSQAGRGGNGGKGSAVFGEGKGGGGGLGGNAGSAAAVVDGTIATTGDRATGISVMSHAGDGGNAGSGAGAAATGGTGGAGGRGGHVDIGLAANARITTSGDLAHAVSALSRGGRGGVGGDASGFFGDAAGGGAGGDGGVIDVRNLGRLATSGNDAVGISAISVGGSGGYGGGAGGVIAIGGSGGGGSDGGTVTIVQGGTIATTGDGSHGVFASSIGGDGGVANSANGVFAFGARGGGDGILLCKLSRGGDYCNNGGAVTVTNRGSITTGGDLALGILAQSLGGGGGAAGSQTGWLAIGGFGGEGGDGGAVKVLNEAAGAIRTSGDKAPAILAQSVGGGGGFAGNANGIAIGVSLEIGGDGGNGGNGGRVDIVNDAALATSGYESPMILAQSIGGGGGNGGDATAEGVSVVNITVGGSGSAGGDGNRVTVINRGALAGALDRSSGIVAQSIGRGGGTGGSGYNATVFPLVDIGIAVGGSGDGGGTGGAVIVENSGAITVAGDDSRAIFAQSVGGGGGMGGSAAAYALTGGPKIAFAAAVAVGGSGGKGSSGSTVTVTNGGQLHTYGDSGHGIQAQSVGGGGGVGGDASASATAITVTGSSIALTVAVGGAGGAGGNGGKVDVVNAASIHTEGSRAHAIFAQSVGGGGGEGGLGDASATQLNARAGVLAKFALKTGAKLFKQASPKFAKGRALQISVGVGGAGGAAGNGDAVHVTNGANLLTELYGSHGIFAQSVGGGGGTGGVGASDAEGIPLTAAVGGSVGVGGSGGASGNGGEVTVINTASITTFGGNAFAIMAQSVGGGGGFADTGTDLTGGQGGTGSGTGGFSAISISIGGHGGANGKGGAVLVDQKGAIATSGKTAHGIFAQSVGGGGGFGGDASNNLLGKVTVSGDGTGEGDGGKVTVKLNGAVTTAGAGAYGVLAQSVGGGGGVGGDVTSLPVTAFGIQLIPAVRAGLITSEGLNGKGGNGGEVLVQGIGAIVTTGQGAHGIFAQSVGGGGGIHGSALLAELGVPSDPVISGIADLIYGSAGNFGTAGAVRVEHSGGISATGFNASAVWAQSIAGKPDAGHRQAGGDVAVTVSGGAYRGGAGDGAGIRIANGNINSITIAADAGVSALSGVAIRVTDDAGFAKTTIRNGGTVTGNVLAGEGLGSDFLNLAGGVFFTGSSVMLKNGTLSNAGLINPGGAGAVQTTALTGAFAQGVGGTLDLDIRVGGASDRIAATGAVALAGTVRPTIAAFTGGWAPVTILTGSSASVTNVALRDTLAVDYSVLASGANIVLDARFDFGLGTRNEAGLNPDEQALGGHLDASAQANATGLSALLTPLANLTVAADYKAALATLTPEAYAAQRWLGIRSTHQLEDAVLSCREGARGAAALRETSCAWLRGNDRSYTADTTAATAGYREDAQSLIGGVQFVLGDDWVIGAAGGYETADFVQQGRASGKVDRTLLAGTAKYMRGGFTGTLTLAASLGNMSMSRIVSGPVPGTAQGSGALDTYGARGRLAYGMAAGVFTIVPRVDFDLSRVRAGAVTETGAGAVALVLPAESETLLAATPAIEIGAAFDIGKVNVRPVLSAGATLYGKDRLSASAVLAGAPSGAAPFGAAAELEGPLYGVSGGVEISGLLGAVVRLEYAGRFARGVEEQSASVKLGIRF